jgi:uncharacterized protein
MATGLIALLDDVAALAKIAAASLDDAATQAVKAGSKAAGIVIDDAAVTPRYVVGFAADRELPLIWRIAKGSLRNKLLFLLPAALALSLVAPWAIPPILMLGGLFLAYEGAHKVEAAVFPHDTGHGPSIIAGSAPELEDKMVAGAVRTDLILSAEIMAITLANVATTVSQTWMQALVLAVVGIGMTLFVYGAVALLVKADDAGVWLARRGNGASRAMGRALVVGMPWVFSSLSVIGTAAMLWVGGGIVLHGLEGYGVAGPMHLIHGWSHAVGDGVLGWLVEAAAAAVVGLVIGVAVLALVGIVQRLRGGVRGEDRA